jgi:aminopeptidase N
MLARGGVDTFKATLSLLEYYAKEDSEPVWDIIALVLADGRRFIDVDPGIEDAIKALVRTLIESQYQRLGWTEFPKESSDDTKLRAMIIGLGVYAEHPAITKQALAYYDEYLQDQTVVSSELRDILFGAAIRYDVPGAFNYLVKLHETTQDIAMRDDAMGALTLTRLPEKAKILLDRLQDPHKVKAQDVDFWIVFLLRNRYTRSVTWSWFTAHWPWIEETFKDDQTYDNFPRYVASAFNTRELLEEYKAFFEPKADQTALARNINMGIEEIENRVSWLERDIAGVQEYFSAKNL